MDGERKGQREFIKGTQTPMPKVPRERQKMLTLIGAIVGGMEPEAEYIHPDTATCWEPVRVTVTAWGVGRWFRYGLKVDEYGDRLKPRGNAAYRRFIRNRVRAWRRFVVEEFLAGLARTGGYGLAQASVLEAEFPVRAIQAHIYCVGQGGFKPTVSEVIGLVCNAIEAEAGDVHDMKPDAMFITVNAIPVSHLDFSALLAFYNLYGGIGMVFTERTTVSGQQVFGAGAGAGAGGVE